jgi:hypothetical protein
MAAHISATSETALLRRLMTGGKPLGRRTMAPLALAPMMREQVGEPPPM